MERCVPCAHLPLNSRRISLQQRVKTILAATESRSNETRVLYVPTNREILEKVCSDRERKYVALGINIGIPTYGKSGCTLVRNSTTDYKPLTVAAVDATFKYKRSLDIG